MDGRHSATVSPASAFAWMWRSLRSDLWPRTSTEIDTTVVKLRMAMDSLNLGMSTMPVAVLIMAALYGLWLPLEYTFSWAAICVALWFPCWSASKRLAASEDIRNSESILDLFFRVSAFVLAFGCQAILFWVPGDPYNNLAVTVNMVGASVAAVMTASWAPLSLLQMTVYLGAIMATGFSTGGVSAWLACMGFVFGPFLLGVVATLHAHLTRLLFLESHKDKLIAELTASNRAKTDFLANMSHELRTPMNAILGFSEIIKDEVLGPNNKPQYRGYAADIHASGSHLLGLINDILDLSKIEAGKFELNESLVDARNIVEETYRILSIRAAQKGVTLINDFPTGIKIWGDASAFRQISLNLGSNALKFTPAGGQVRWRVEMADRIPAFIIEDTGCGIRPEDLWKIFESFGQGRHDIALQEKGTGLGLPIVRGLARAHGGDVTLSSELGKGTTVRVTLDPARIRQIPDDLRANAA